MMNVDGNGTQHTDQPVQPTQQALDDLHALSVQLNRQAFARPPIEGWLNSFLTMLCERFRAVRGIQAMQVIGNVAVRMGSAGTLPADAYDQYPLDEATPIVAAMRTRQMAHAPGAHVYPITVGEDNVGVLIAYGASDEALALIDHLIAALALQLAPAIIQNLKTPGSQTGRLTHQINMMRSLAEATKTVSSALESTEVLNRAARSVVETLRVEHVGIVVFDLVKRAGTVVAEYPDSGLIGVQVPMYEPLYEQMQTSRAPFVVPNVDDSEHLGPIKEGLQAIGVKSVALIPLFVQDELIGTVGLDVYYEYREFTPEEIEGAMAITTQLAISVRNAQLYGEIKRQAHTLEGIANLSRRVMSTFDRDLIFQIVKEETHRVIEADLVSVALRQPDQGDSSPLQLVILGDGEPTHGEFELGETALRFVLSNNEPLVLDDIAGSEYPDYKLLAQSGVHAAMIVPLLVGGRAVGTYCVLHHQPAFYTSGDLAVLEQIGNQLVIALENARLYQQTAQRAETERLMNRLSGTMQERGSLQRMLLATVQEMAEALGAKRARIRLQTPPAQTANAARLVSLTKLADKLAEKQTDKQTDKQADKQPDKREG
jgi:GAF domain-containing protein